MNQNNKYPMPPIAWLQITGYTHDWLCNELGGSITLYEKPVLSITHLQGARKILRMQTENDMTVKTENRCSLSAMMMDCLQLGCVVGPRTMSDTYNITKEQLNLYLPIECPRMALTEYGVLRPWDRTTAFSKNQANALLFFLRKIFWDAVKEHNDKLISVGQAPETAIQLIESFVAETGTNEIWIPDLRREWQRQMASKRKKSDVN